MTNPVRLPLLLLNDVVLLPGMVVPIELDDAARAAIDAAQLEARDPETGSEGTARVLVAPRLEDRYASYGVIASVERTTAPLSTRRLKSCRLRTPFTLSSA